MNKSIWVCTSMIGLFWRKSRTESFLWIKQWSRGTYNLEGKMQINMLKLINQMLWVHRNNTQMQIYASFMLVSIRTATCKPLTILIEASYYSYWSSILQWKIYTLSAGKWCKGSSPNPFDKSLSSLSSWSSGSDVRMPTNSKMSFSFSSDSGVSYI